jgi:hypothetical protein
MQGISCVADQLLASEDRLGSMEFVSHFSQFFQAALAQIMLPPIY